MYKNILLRTNLLICVILIVGFISVSIVSYNSNTGAFKKDIEHVSTLTSESIYYQIDSYFSKPISVSLTMANDSLLKTFLSNETENTNNPAYLKELQQYLNAYKEQYGYDSVFLVSTRTRRYYHFDGLDRVLTPDNPENKWYYSFLDGSEEYSMNVDNDEAAEDVITVFVNCRITNDNGATMGVVGVGLRIEHLQKLLQSYDEKYDIQALLIDRAGALQISSADTGEEPLNLFDDPGYAEEKEKILDAGPGLQAFWRKEAHGERYMAAQYVPALKWNLIIENNTTRLQEQFRRQFVCGCCIMALIILLVLIIVNKIISDYNSRLLKLTVSQTMEYQKLLREAAEGLYENVYELDITHNRAGGDGTREFFISLGMSGDTPYQEALKVIAAKQIREEFRQGYLETFSPENVLNAYHNGLTELYYDFMITEDGRHYRWMRIRARIFFWDSDQSVRMITYRQDITAEKEHDAEMLRLAQSDPLTGLYNKEATREHIGAILKRAETGQCHALLMVDIDRFKSINDSYGHVAGDTVIQEFGERLKRQFRETDVCGRVGGDEFMAFLQGIPPGKRLTRHLEDISASLRGEIPFDGGSCAVSASIGVALYPEDGTEFDTLYRNADAALYRAKENGRDCFVIFNEKERERTMTTQGIFSSLTSGELRAEKPETAS